MRRFAPALAVIAIMIAIAGALYLWADARQQAAIERLTELPPELQPQKPADKQLLSSWVDAVKANPGDTNGWNSLAGVLFNVGAYAQSEQAYQKSLQIDDTQADIWSLAGEARVRQGKQSDPVSVTAQFAFNQALRLDPKNLRAHFYVSLADYNDGKHDRAIDRMRYVAEASEKNSMAQKAAQETLREWSAAKDDTKSGSGRR